MKTPFTWKAVSLIKSALLFFVATGMVSATLDSSEISNNTLFSKEKSTPTTSVFESPLPSASNAIVSGPCGSNITTVDASNPLGNDGSITISGLADGTEVRVVSVRNNFDTQLEARNFPYVLSNLKPGIYAIRTKSNGCDEIKAVSIGPCGQVLIDTVQVSSCYPNNGSKATVSVQVNWTGGADSIAIEAGGQTKYIKTADGNSSGMVTPSQPAVLAFEIPANGANVTVKAFFVSHPECGETIRIYKAPAPCEPVQCTTLGGSVFNDYNGDGVREARETNGVPGIIVKAYAPDGSIYSAFTDQYGLYDLNIPTNKYPLRVEFTNIPHYLAGGTSTPVGTNNRTTIQFVAAPNCQVNIGVNNLNDFCQKDPLMVIPCWVRGDPLSSTSTGASNPGPNDALVAFPSSNRGVQERPGNATPLHLAYASQVGTLWGAAYNKYTKQLFTSAVLRRHAGLGPLGLGGIYIVDMAKTDTTATQPFLDVATIGIDVGTIFGRQLTTDLTSNDILANRDSAAFSMVGKAGMGDLEISEDGKLLWFINLKDSKLYSIDISNYNTDGVTKPTAADVKSYTIPNPGCSGGAMRPWGTKIREGKVYIGLVCDGSISGNRSDMNAIIYQFDPALGSGPEAFKTIFKFPLTYPKGSPFEDPIDPATNGWFTWSDDFNVTKQGNAHPSPFVADIEFDIDGSMVLSFGDRTALQMGGDIESSPDGASTGQNFVGGDILRVNALGGAFVLENNAKAGPNIGSAPNNNQGPGFGEFYNDDFYYTGHTAPTHSEVIIGGMAIRPGSGEVTIAAMDPINSGVNPMDSGDDSTYAKTRDIWWSGGVRALDNKTGALNKGYVLYQSIDTNPPSPSGIQLGSFFKSAGLGDIEFICDNVNYIEVGNRVWVDIDKDGVQDADEPPLEGVQVNLYLESDGSLIAQTTTNADGLYYFNASKGVAANTNYLIVYGNGQFTSDRLALNGIEYLVTTTQSGQGGTPNLNDSNIDSDSLTIATGSIPAGLPYFAFRTGIMGYVNHSIDAGFVECPKLAPIPSQEICYNSAFAPVVTRDINGGEPTYQWYNNAGSNNPGSSPVIGATNSVFTQLPTEVGFYRFKVVATVQVLNQVCRDSTIVELRIKPQPVISLDSVVCSSDRLFYSLYYHTSPANTPVTSSMGAVFNGIVTGIASSSNTTLTATLDGCSNVLEIATPNCNCPYIAPPTSNGDAISCTGQTTSTLAVSVPSGQSVNWYNAPVDGIRLATATTQFQPDTSGTYYAQAILINGADTCYSVVRTAVVFTIAPKPRISAINTDTICQPGTVDLSKVLITDSTGTNPAFGYPKFYTSAADAFLNQNPLVNTKLSNPVDRQYWIRWQTATGCFDTTSIRVVIHPRPAVKILTADCSFDARTYSIRYSIPAGATLTTNFDNYPGVVFQPGMITGVPIRQSITLLATSPFGCTDAISVPSPTCPCPPIDAPKVLIQDVPYCVGDPLPPLFATITDPIVTGTIFWYDAAQVGSLLSVGPTFTPTQPGIYYAEARDTVSLCQSSVRVPATVRKVNKPVLTILDTICAADGRTYSITFDTLNVTTLLPNRGVINGNSITSIPQGEMASITASNGACFILDTIRATCTPTYGSIGNFVWIDTDQNGKQGLLLDEPPVAGMTVRLMDGNGRILRGTITNQDGKYLFDSLEMGSYQVQFMQMSSMEFTQPKVSPSDNDSDALLLGKTELIFINVALPANDVGRNNLTIDAGIHCPGTNCIPVLITIIQQHK